MSSTLLMYCAVQPVSAQDCGARHGFRCGSPEQAGASAEGLAGLSVRVADWVREGAIVGGEILVIKDDRILLHDVVGWSDREAGTPLRLNSVYHIASMTKPFVGTAILMLAEEGQVELDQRVSEFLPSFDRPEVRTITVRQLLTHTAGWANEGPFPSDFVRSVPDLRTLVDSIAARGPAYAPGQAYRYGDTHSWILGAIVEALSGVPSDRFIEERILAPLKLSDTRAGFRGEPGWTDRVNPRYRRGPDGWVEVWDPADAEPLPFFRATGGAYSTALDYAAWLRTWMDFLDGDADGPERLISAPLARAAVTKGPLDPGYGLHWYLYGDAPLVFGHGGSDGTRAWAVPSERLIIIYLTQSRGHDTLGEFGRLALDAAVPGLRMRTRLPEISAGELDYDLRAVSLEEAEEFLGDYAIDDEWIRIRWDDGRFRIDPDFWIPYDLASIGGDRFVMVSPERGRELSIAGPAVQIEFRTTSSGDMALRMVRVDGDAVDFEAIRRR